MNQTFKAVGPSTLLCPVPAVLLSCTDPDTGKHNLITVAWAGVVNSEPPMISVSIRKERFSHDMIEKSGLFCLNLTSREICKAVDFCGVRSGRNGDKFQQTGLHPYTVEDFAVPAVQEAPAFMCCSVRQVIPLGSHDLFLCDVRQVYAKEGLFNEDGSLHMDRAGLIAYAHGEYFPLERCPSGFFGYSVAREEVIQRRLIAPYRKLKDSKPGYDSRRKGRTRS